ncbi:hypothetical protein ACFH04_13320 [Streptomyces noboritoensis]|uniref:Uncharacterized protein n=1 Tax=Streptomyces noboritoensis TaxID=67337 RepID=A0ABV6TFV8_9ACTN
MARIRTIKPEAFESEDLASVSVTAMLTFFGLLTQADDAGRFRDHPAVIAGRLWALRREHTPANVAEDLEQLAQAGLVCRYTGCDGKRWLHVVTWDRHQRINRPSDSRLPRCPAHEAAQGCGECGKTRCAAGQHGLPADAAAEPATSPSPAPEVARPATPTATATTSPVVPTTRRVTQATTAGSQVTRTTKSEVTQVTMARHAPVAATPAPAAASSTPPSSLNEESAGHGIAAEEGVLIGPAFSEASRTGSRILDPGSSRRGREAPAPDAVPEQLADEASAGEWSAKRLMSEYIRACPGGRAPKSFLGHLGKQIRLLLEEGYGPDTLRPALERLRVKGLHPSVLPSLVNEVLNAEPVPAPSSGWSVSSASGAGLWGHAPSPASTYTPYLNTTEPTGVFGVAL